MSFVNSIFIQTLIYWIFNIISPSINSQAITTYILAKQSKYCQQFNIFGISFFNSIGENTIGWNWIILILHIIILLWVLIAMDSGLLNFSFSFSCLNRPMHFNENILDNDVLAERRRILDVNHSKRHKRLLNENTNEDGDETDHLIVHDLVKRYRRRNTYAVNHLTFGAKRGEAFGLLGYNVSRTNHTYLFFLNVDLKFILLN